MTDHFEYILVLGRSPELSILEIETTLARSGISIVDLTLTGGLALVKTEQALAESWFLSLGGARKIAKVFDHLEGVSLAQAVDALSAQANGKLVGISSFGMSSSAELGKAVKHRSQTVRRYLVPEKGRLISDAQSKGLAGGNEFIVLVHSDQTFLAQVEAVQDIDEFTRRDRKLPNIDPKRGMLPTKLARIMVNIGLGLIDLVYEPLLLDPFCGTGRIPIEAVLLGAKVVASDIDEEAVTATRENLNWLAETSGKKPDVTVIQSAISDLATRPEVVNHQFDLVVTEPYLGPPLRKKPSPSEVEGIFLDLEPIYRSLLLAARTLLANHGGMVVVFPYVNDLSLLDRFIDTLGENGYNLADSVRVSRPDSLIGREITILKRA